MIDRLQKDIRFWDRVADKYAASVIADQAGYETTLQAVRAHLLPDHHVLEIGCGTGTTALQLADAVATYLGTDIAPAMVRIARDKANASGHETVMFEVRVAEARQTSHKPFDVILAFNMLHLVPDPAKAISAVYEQLSPGGLFISKTPCLTRMNPLIRLAIPIMQMIGKAPSVQTFSPEDLDLMLKTSGFEIVERGWHGNKGKDIRAYRVAQKA